MYLFLFRIPKCSFLNCGKFHYYSLDHECPYSADMKKNSPPWELFHYIMDQMRKLEGCKRQFVVTEEKLIAPLPIDSIIILRLVWPRKIYETTCRKEDMTCPLGVRTCS